eukprot:Blabericola_migrator_1__7517@NODE_383_length_9140_cov_403_746611_g306_i0_p2_GENE_NODE_383_length_9140_cov_403_746611_g306_i0NODE_383_length_9140_cov_403_746611_g306_i0_p2_ORF_typecomplete_len702_score190_18HTH_9/PF08221_11/1_4e04HTH_9/PF08221_11/0_66HTH_9/PF08221_11/5_7e02TrmB/PF01978_19/10TrmB/PF01978_19/84TrmB/PF01978_19/6_6e03_NODE_383_length_9140_cov_403_746611_g306_i068688973
MTTARCVLVTPGSKLLGSAFILALSESLIAVHPESFSRFVTAITNHIGSVDSRPTVFQNRSVNPVKEVKEWVDLFFSLYPEYHLSFDIKKVNSRLYQHLIDTHGQYEIPAGALGKSSLPTQISLPAKTPPFGVEVALYMNGMEDQFVCQAEGEVSNAARLRICQSQIKLGLGKLKSDSCDPVTYDELKSSGQISIWLKQLESMDLEGALKPHGLAALCHKMLCECVSHIKSHSVCLSPSEWLVRIADESLKHISIEGTKIRDTRFDEDAYTLDTSIDRNMDFVLVGLSVLGEPVLTQLGRHIPSNLEAIVTQAFEKVDHNAWVQPWNSSLMTYAFDVLNRLEDSRPIARVILSNFLAVRNILMERQQLLWNPHTHTVIGIPDSKFEKAVSLVIDTQRLKSPSLPTSLNVIEVKRAIESFLIQEAKRDWDSFRCNENRDMNACVSVLKTLIMSHKKASLEEVANSLGMKPVDVQRVKHVLSVLPIDHEWRDEVKTLLGVSGCVSHKRSHTPETQEYLARLLAMPELAQNETAKSVLRKLKNCLECEKKGFGGFHTPSIDTPPHTPQDLKTLAKEFKRYLYNGDIFVDRSINLGDVDDVLTQLTQQGLVSECVRCVFKMRRLCQSPTLNKSVKSLISDFANDMEKSGWLWKKKSKKFKKVMCVMTHMRVECVDWATQCVEQLEELVKLLGGDVQNIWTQSEGV